MGIDIAVVTIELVVTVVVSVVILVVAKFTAFIFEVDSSKKVVVVFPASEFCCSAKTTVVTPFLVATSGVVVESFTIVGNSAFEGVDVLLTVSKAAELKNG